MANTYYIVRVTETSEHEVQKGDDINIETQIFNQLEKRFKTEEDARAFVEERYSYVTNLADETESFIYVDDGSKRIPLVVRE